MKNVEIYMTESVDDGGLNKVAGNIYTVPEHTAEKFEEEGTAKVVNYPSLRVYTEAIEDITEQYKTKKKQIDDNLRLTDEAKADDKRELLEECKKKVEEIEADYRQEIDKLLEKATAKAGEIKPKLDYDKDVVRVKVGHIKADVAMSTSFTEALEILQKEVRMIDKNVASELLAHFTEIKQGLDELGQNIDKIDRSRYIRSIYDDLKQKSQDEKQMGALLEIDILNAMKKSSGIGGIFRIATMFDN